MSLRFQACAFAESLGRLQECAALYSEHYGTWSSAPGKRVRMTPERMRQGYLFDDQCRLVLALFLCASGGDKASEQVVGYAAVRHYPFRSESALWVAQLVVHTEHRRRGIATEMLRRARSQAQARFAGMASANPCGPRALYRATDGPRLLDSSSAQALMRASQVPYLCRAEVSSAGHVDTAFAVDRTGWEPHRLFPAAVGSTDPPPEERLVRRFEALPAGCEHVLCVSREDRALVRGSATSA